MNENKGNENELAASKDEREAKLREWNRIQFEKKSNKWYGVVFKSAGYQNFKKAVSKISRWRIGKFPMGRVLGFGLMIAIVMGTSAIVRTAFNTWDLASYDYQLTQEQKDAGYTFTEEQHSKSSSPDDIAYRFFTEDEEMQTPECAPGEACWDFKVIPLVNSCTSIYAKLNFYETDNFLAAPIDSVTKVFKNTGRGLFIAGREYDFRLGSKNAKTNYAAFDRVYCETFGN